VPASQYRAATGKGLGVAFGRRSVPCDVQCSAALLTWMQ